ncbi:CocE/NonD family hydrolase [Rhodoplanes sp. TEM]|uniref:CocE/NonD family hydrolase n=1 Tax=Rhodoplanes tepidamans TaxID=200616 RepID=A0ABT5JGG5_RHOTP|nr:MULTISPECIES: CocE/NonD family hydrolase [Rhodoplanes]MDC7788791.1 CocE/NonD family hydrolase [Rhodoplanes tepidamans]MDC7984123.1 CocE/NonD family hydrolase [Rhodoplanes sp. TEM]MDQ0356897.1 putative acyl esterase [Rhodoplanes tepidamans]
MDTRSDAAIVSRSETRDGMRIDWNVPITMDDGVVLRADVFGPVKPGRYPVIMSYGPYAKGLAFQDGYPSAWTRMAEQHPDVTAGSSNLYQSWEVVDPEKWVPHDYVCVRVDSRGCGCSEGVVDPWSPREARDFHDCIEWAAAQDWSNGKVGLNGISYYGTNQWQVAGLQPPHLAAMCIWEGFADFYRDLCYHGGILCTFAKNWYDMQVKTVQYGLGERGARSRVTGEPVCGGKALSEEELAGNRRDFGGDIAAHPLDDDWHKGRSAAWDKVTVPFLSAANWGGQPLHPRGNFEGFMRAASPDKWLEVHGIEHWTHFYTDYGRELQLKFFDHFLHGKDNGWREQPRVFLQVRHVDRFEPRAEAEWPLARTQWTRLHLDPATLTLGREPSGREARTSFAAAGDGVTFLSAPFPHETEITGPMAAKLFVSSTTTDADLFLVVRVFSPDMKEVTFQGAIDPHAPVAQGWLRASHRKLDRTLSTPWRPYHAHDEEQPLVPGEIAELDVEIWPTSIVVPAGYRLGLTVRGKDYVWPGGSGGKLSNFKNELTGCGPFLHDDPDDRPADVFGGTTTLHATATRQSWLLVPFVPAPAGEARRVEPAVTGVTSPVQGVSGRPSGVKGR